MTASVAVGEAVAARLRQLGEAKRTEWQRFAAVVVTNSNGGGGGGGGEVVCSSFPVDEPLLQDLSACFDSKEAAIGSGLHIEGEVFEVFKWHAEHQPPVLYGRRHDPTVRDPHRESEAVAVTRITAPEPEGAHDIIVLATFRLPVTSARAVPELLEGVRVAVSA